MFVKAEWSCNLSAKLDLLAAFAEIARGLGNAHRLDLLEHLAQGEKGVETLAAKSGLTVANASQHLQALRRVGLVVGERRGKQVVYRLSGDDVLDLVAALRTVGERHADSVKAVVRDYFNERDALDAVAFQVLEQRLRDGLVTLLDVRPPDEFADGHVPGALNIPLADLKARLAEIPSGAEVVAYCRGPWCVLAFEAVALLRQTGRDAKRLDGGLPEWRRAGRQVAGPPAI
ncbi:MAG: metalloregulator ArsR/SmtB family transcription factor [Caulobacter sp.]|nr:metalloregulator ArsR/SmtB family transcription factor [Caulobacter sp.]